LLIEHGCEFLIGNRCGIYKHRPTICRRFSCRDLAD
jgi:Fe-S-cluster containining protein